MSANKRRRYTYSPKRIPKQFPQSDIWYTTSKVASDLHITVRCLYNWLNDEVIHSIKPGKKRLINKADYDALLGNNPRFQ